MTVKQIKRKIRFRKNMLNFLMRYLNPTNPIVIYLSQDLDKLISLYQGFLYKRHMRSNVPLRKYRKIAA